MVDCKAVDFDQWYLQGPNTNGETPSGLERHSFQLKKGNMLPTELLFSDEAEAEAEAEPEAEAEAEAS